MNNWNGLILRHLVRQVADVLYRVDSRPDLAAITVPTPVLVGEQDHLTPPEVARELAAGIAHSQLVVVPACGHGSTIEQPQAVNHAIQAWLTS
jgi:pimeloyl-ACP methyl ester carboxylesterase